MIPAEVLDSISHGEVKGEGVLVLRADAALRGRRDRVRRGAREAQWARVSCSHLLEGCSGRRLWEMFTGWTVSGIFALLCSGQ